MIHTLALESVLTLSCSLLFVHHLCSATAYHLHDSHFGPWKCFDTFVFNAFRWSPLQYCAAYPLRNSHFGPWNCSDTFVLIAFRWSLLQYRGVPSPGFTTQDLENPAQKQYFKVRKQGWRLSEESLPAGPGLFLTGQTRLTRSNAVNPLRQLLSSRLERMLSRFERQVSEAAAVVSPWTHVVSFWTFKSLGQLLSSRLERMLSRVERSSLWGSCCRLALNACCLDLNGQVSEAAAVVSPWTHVVSFWMFKSQVSEAAAFVST